MVFSSFTFIFYFLPPTLAIYYLTPHRFRNAALLIVSLFFYGWSEPRYLLLMVLVILLNYACGRRISGLKAQSRDSKPILILSIIANLAILIWFKYSSFTIKSFHDLGLLKNVPVPAVVLPIGISFYIFQSMSYTIDVYRQQTKAQENLVDFGCYVSMFPQLIAGPIVRYRDIDAQLKNRKENYIQFSDGVLVFIIGLSQKVLLANPMGNLWEEMSASSGTLAAWTGMIAYTLQIYFDFSGYSDMAVGLGKMFGFNFLENFNYPYISCSVTEFWRRWHISLSSWFKEYVYIPLGGNRNGLLWELRNILIVWMLTGLWHGAGWNFVIWGLYYAAFLIAEKLFLLKALEKVPSFLKHIFLMLTVSFGWMIFYFEDMSRLKCFFERLFTLIPTDRLAITEICAYIPVFCIAVLGSTPVFSSVAERMKPGIGKKVLRVLIPSCLFLLCVAALSTQSYNPFIYFRF